MVFNLSGLRLKRPEEALLEDLFVDLLDDGDVGRRGLLLPASPLHDHHAPGVPPAELDRGPAVRAVKDSLGAEGGQHGDLITHEVVLGLEQVVVEPNLQGEKCVGQEPYFFLVKTFYSPAQAC